MSQRDAPDYILDLVRESAVRDIPKGLPRVLEVGCGDGLVLSLLLEKSPKALVGLDVKDNGLRHKGKYLFIIGDMQWLPIRSNLFDALICVNTIEMVKRRESVKGVREMARVIKKGGTIAISIKNILNPLMYLRVGYRKIYYRLKRQVFFRLSHLTELLEKTGCRIDKMEPISPYPLHYPANPIWRVIKRSFAVLYWHIFAKRFTFSPLYNVFATKR